jgi:hypothetical protein
MVHVVNVQNGGKIYIMKNTYQLLADKWKQQADESDDEREQAWLYACSADLVSEINKNKDNNV